MINDIELIGIRLTRREVLGSYLTMGLPECVMLHDLGDKASYDAAEVCTALDWWQAAAPLQCGNWIETQCGIA